MRPRCRGVNMGPTLTLHPSARIKRVCETTRRRRRLSFGRVGESRRFCVLQDVSWLLAVSNREFSTTLKTHASRRPPSTIGLTKSVFVSAYPTSGIEVVATLDVALRCCFTKGRLCVRSLCFLLSLSTFPSLSLSQRLQSSIVSETRW